MATVNFVIQQAPLSLYTRVVATVTTGGLPEESGVDATMPKMAIQASGTVPSSGALNKTMPKVAIQAGAIIMSSGALNATMPMVRLTASAVPAVGAALNASMPMAQLTARTGARLAASMPMAQLAATATAQGVGRVNAAMPTATLNATAKVGAIARLAGVMPMATLTTRAGARLAANIPAMTLQSAARTGGVARLAEFMPMMALGASGTVKNSARLDGAMPMVRVPERGALMASMPMMTVEAKASQAVAQLIREAYSVTIGEAEGGAQYDMTHYTGYPFIDVIRLGNRFFGVAADAVHEIGVADTDNGQPIPWAIETLATDFGATALKTVVSAYVGGRHSPQACYTIRWGDGMDREYLKSTVHTGANANTRQRFGIGRKARFYSLGISDEEGGHAHIENLEFEVGTLTRRIAP